MSWLENLSYPKVMKIFSNIIFWESYCFAIHIDIYILHLELTDMNVKFYFSHMDVQSTRPNLLGENIFFLISCS